MQSQAAEQRRFGRIVHWKGLLFIGERAAPPGSAQRGRGQTASESSSRFHVFANLALVIADRRQTQIASAKKANLKPFDLGQVVKSAHCHGGPGNRGRTRAGPGFKLRWLRVTIAPNVSYGHGLARDWSRDRGGLTQRGPCCSTGPAAAGAAQNDSELGSDSESAAVSAEPVGRNGPAGPQPD